MVRVCCLCSYTLYQHTLFYLVSQFPCVWDGIAILNSRLLWWGLNELIYVNHLGSDWYIVNKEITSSLHDSDQMMISYCSYEKVLSAYFDPPSQDVNNQTTQYTLKENSIYRLFIHRMLWSYFTVVLDIFGMG